MSCFSVILSFIYQTPGKLEHDKDPLLVDEEVVCAFNNYV